MKHVVFWPLLLLLACNTVGLSQTYTVEFAYYDLSSGPLSLKPGSQAPIEDGGLCQIIEDDARDGISGPNSDGSPGDGDRLLPVTSKSGIESIAKTSTAFNTFLLNGEDLFGSAGYFLVSPGISGTLLNSYPIYLRIWNSSTLRTATAYWDTPLYRIIPGHQQMAFDKAKLSYHSFVPTGGSNDETSLRPQEASSLSAIIRDFAIHDAYPNPFNPTTTITLDLPEAALVDLQVFDVMGRQVRHLMNEVHPAGQFQVMFDGSNLSSGLYIVSAKLGDKFMANKKITLLK